MEDSQELYNQIQSQVAQERQLPPEVLEDSINEKAEYEKDLLQGAGGLLAGGSVERGFKLLAKSPKGVKALKKLGMSDEDVDTVITAIKSRDSGALTDFLARKGTGFVENTAKKLGIKGGKVAKTTIKKLKEGKLPTRQELQDSINEGGGKQVTPSKSNLKKKPTEDSAGGEDESSSIFDALKSKAESTIKSVKGSIQDSIGDSPSRVSNLIDKADEFKSKGFGRVNSAFDRARADGVEDLEGQSSAVRKLLSNSKKGRKLLRKNAKSKAEGGESEPPKKPTTEFDQEDEQGDLLSELSKLGKRGKRALSKAKEELPTEPTEIDAITGQEVNPLAKIRAGKQKIEDQFKEAQEQIENEGVRDPYQDIYDQASRDAQKFTPDELGVGKKLEKDVDFKFKAPTREEHLKQLADQEKGKEPMLKTDEKDPDLTDEAFADEEVKPTIPASEQTGGIDPSTLPDDAGFTRGSAKIQAKTEVEPRGEQEEQRLTAEREAPEPAPEPVTIEPTVPEPPKSIPDEDIVSKTNIPEAPKPPPQEEERLTTEQEAPKPPEPQLQLQTTRPPIDESEVPPKPTVNKPNLNPDKDPALDGSEEALSKGEKVEDGLKGAFEDSLEGDEDPFGVILSGILGIGALIGGAFKKAHHPHFIQPPSLHPYENFSVQEGVA